MFSNFRTADELMSQQEPDEYPIRTDSPCPFCGQLVEWNGDQLYCEPCRLVWPNFEELRADVWVAKAKAQKAAHSQRDEDASGYADTVGAGLERRTR